MSAMNKKVNIALDKNLLSALDRAARRAKQSRSELVREALRAHLLKLDVRILEEQEREGYRRIPQTCEELQLCEAEASWLQE